ncbi:MAG: type II restriction endonuclease [Clostridia bacterium]|nr:type II restriction endonuclease [Clostridia bacterium]
MDLVSLGSLTAKNGFKNETDVANKFINWKNDADAQSWLSIMQYNLNEIEYVDAKVLHGYKADVNVQVKIKLKNAIDTENLQVKLVSNKKGFNQVDKRRLEKYQELWNMPNNVYKALQYFTGELEPYIDNPRDGRRMFLDEMTENDRNCILNWFLKNKTLVLSDIIKGRGKFSAEWILVAQKVDKNARWVLKNINYALQHYSTGDVCMSPRGSIVIGKVTVQRKGGDNGRDTAKMLQFKLDPSELFNDDSILKNQRTVL